MTEKNEELELINHLLEVEKNASVLIEDAMKEADAKKVQATAIFNNEFKEKYESAMAVKKAAFESKIEEIKINHEKEIQDYKKQIEEKPVNKTAFNEVLEKLLLENA